jgi:DNA-binding FrmR family transcriptional regulator
MSKHFFPYYPPPGLAKCDKMRYNAIKSSSGGIHMADIHEHHDHAYLHAHGIAHSHGHVHENQKAVLNRLARAIGHLEKVKRMVEDGVDCSEVLIQLAAVRSALDNTGKVILKDHIHHCMVDAVAAGDEDAIDDLCQAIDKFMK